MDVGELVTASERKIVSLREAIRAEEQFLNELRDRVGLPPVTADAIGAKLEKAQAELLNALMGAGRRAERGEKRTLALIAMRDRPGTWTTKEINALYEENGIDPDAGTPAKNVLWHLAREGIVTAQGNGSYFFDPNTARAHEALRGLEGP